jgi:hypothetical protein
VVNFGPGFSAPFSTGPDGTGYPTCGPSRNRVEFKATLAAERRLMPQQDQFPQIGRSNLQLPGSHGFQKGAGPARGANWRRYSG